MSRANKNFAIFEIDDKRREVLIADGSRSTFTVIAKLDLVAMYLGVRRKKVSR